MAYNTTFFTLPPQSAAVDINWNIIVCDGNVTSIVVIPSQHTVLQLKELIEKKVNIPVSEQKAIYFQEKPLPDDRCLSDCEGMRNGSAVLVARKPFTIHVYRNDVDITKTVEAPPTEVQSWSVGNLHDYILTKVGVPTYVPHILALGEVIIEWNDHLHTVSQKPITSGCHMTLTILQQVQYDKLDCVTQQSQVLSAPMSTSHTFMTSSVFHGKKVGTAMSDMHLQGAQAASLLGQSELWMGCLVLYVQKLDGAKAPIQLPDHSCTSVMSLREKIRDSLEVPTYQQRLMLGETELEDWDEENKPLVLYNYPSVQNGSTIYLIVLTEGIHVKKGFSGPQILQRVLPSRRNLCFDLKEKDFIYHPSYVNILNTKGLTLKQLKSRLNPDSWQTSSRAQMSSMGIGHPSVGIGSSMFFSIRPVPKLCLNPLQGSPSPQHTVEITDAPVSTVPWITDGCTLYLYNK